MREFDARTGVDAGEAARRRTAGATRTQTNESRPPPWQVRSGCIGLERPAIMGVLNVTPDSFSDGGRYLDPVVAAERAHAMIAEGAALVDVGGESSRPGAGPVSTEEEWARVGPVLGRLQGFPAPISIDTTKAEIARRALDCGAAVLNDISGLRRDPQLADLAAATGAGLVLMHMRGEPRTMQEDVHYDDLVSEIRESLCHSVRLALARGCATAQLVVDPGIGFGKSPAGNLELLARLTELLDLDLPILVGPSRKSFIGQVSGDPAASRLEGTIAACVMALDRGARIFRVHDVAAVRRALVIADAIRRADKAI